MTNATTDQPKQSEDTIHTEETNVKFVDSTSDDRTLNNAVRHNYRVLSEQEKRQMQSVKDAGAAFIAEIMKLQNSVPQPPELMWAEKSAKEAVMWACNYITGTK